MRKNYLLKLSFFLRFKTTRKLRKILRTKRYKWLGMKVGKGTLLPFIGVSWPHQVSIGNYCNLENGISFRFDGIYKDGPNIIIGNNVFLGTNIEFNIRKKISVGDDCLIGSDCKFIDHDHGFKLNELIRNQGGTEQAIYIGKDVWLGSNAIVLKGITIGDGAIIGANSLVNKSIPANEIWAGNPIKFIRKRQ